MSIYETEYIVNEVPMLIMGYNVVKYILKGQ